MSLRLKEVPMLKKKTQERLGEILLRKGVLTKAALSAALAKQKTDGCLLGESLISLGYVTEQEICQAIISQYGVPFLPVENYEINRDAVSLVPEELSRKHQFVPVDLIGDILVGAMVNPVDRKAIEHIGSISGKKVNVFIAFTSSVNEAIDKVYS